MKRHTLLLCALLAVGCGWETPGGSDTGLADDPTLTWPELGNQPEFDDGVWVYGTVSSPSGTVGVAGAVIAAEVAGESVWTLSLDGGRFRLMLPPANWDLAVTKGRYQAQGAVDLSDGREVQGLQLTLDPGEVEIGVVHGEYDDVGALIHELGFETSNYATVASILGDPTALEDTDVLFLNCGTDLGVGDGYTQAQGAVLRSWIEGGGTLYASDWEWQAFALASPGGLSWASNPESGTPGYVEAQLIDRGLQALMGAETATLAFDLGQWAMPSGPGTAEVLVQGSPPAGGGVRPLAAIDRLGEGRLIFTSFHNEAQATADMQLILYEVILSL